MKKLALFAILALLLGCVAPIPPTNGSDTNNSGGDPNDAKSVVIDQNTVYTHGNIAIEVISFTDSRCPQDVQCIWEGELGVILKVSSQGQVEEVILGEKTRPSAQAFGYTLTIGSIDFTNKKLTLVISKNSDETKRRVWFSFGPKQCNSNPWDDSKYQRATCQGPGCPSWGEENAIKLWLDDKGIKVYGYASHQKSEIVCAACSCPRGDEIAVLVNNSDSQKMVSLGWVSLGSEIACTEDAKLCPDGSGVGREGPFCEFPTCPGGDIVNANEIVIQKINVPGFTINPQTVTAIIYGDGYYVIETTNYNSDTQEQTVSATTGNIGKEKVQELVDLIESTNFFSLTEEDTRSCIADPPTITLDIKIEEKSKVVSGIGTECDKQKLEESRKIIKEIEELLGQEPHLLGQES